MEINLPWRAVPREELQIMGEAVIEDSAGDYVCSVFDDDYAKIIVESVNAHQELLAKISAVMKFREKK